jgi:hypothetical protein
VHKACSNFVGGWVQGGDNLDRAEHIAQARRVELKFIGGLLAVSARLEALWFVRGTSGILCKPSNAA